MTKIKQEFIWSTVDDRPFIGIHDWVSTLPETEKQEFREACDRQDFYKSEAIREGLMYLDADGSYIWKDQTAFDKGKGIDPIWEKYWLRWHKECGIVFQQRGKEI